VPKTRESPPCEHDGLASCVRRPRLDALEEGRESSFLVVREDAS
jgi:hypothetical protein